MACPVTNPNPLSSGLNLDFGMKATEKQTRHVTSKLVSHGSSTPHRRVPVHSPQTGVPAALTAAFHCCGSVGVDAGVGVDADDDVDDSHNA